MLRNCPQPYKTKATRHNSTQLYITLDKLYTNSTQLYKHNKLYENYTLYNLYTTFTNIYTTLHEFDHNFTELDNTL